MSREEGFFYEDITAEFLTLKGFGILERNFSAAGGEIDIIAEKGKKMYIVEVKSRKYPSAYEPYEAVGLSKKRKIKKAALFYSGRFPRRDYVFFVASVKYSGDWIELRFLEDEL